MTDQFCPECGHDLEGEPKFCPECGTSLSGAAPDATTAPTDATGESSDSTGFAAITHLLGLFTWIIGPIVVLAVTDDAFVAENARNALNWQVMFTIYMIVAIPLAFLLIGIPLLLILPVLDLVFCVVAAVKAADGEAWSYPITPDLF